MRELDEVLYEIIGMISDNNINDKLIKVIRYSMYTAPELMYIRWQDAHNILVEYLIEDGYIRMDRLAEGVKIFSIFSGHDEDTIRNNCVKDYDKLKNKVVEIQLYDTSLSDFENTFNTIKNIRLSTIYDDTNINSEQEITYNIEFKRTTLYNAIEIYNEYINRCNKIIDGLKVLMKYSEYAVYNIGLYINKVTNFKQKIEEMIVDLYNE